MQENAVSPNLKLTYGSVDIDDAVDELLIIYPDLTEEREKLLAFFQVAWRGEWPVQFIEDIALLDSCLPWLNVQLQKWLGSIQLPVNDRTFDNELYARRRAHWAALVPGQVNRRMTIGKQLEGLLLLSKLQFGPYQNECAHRLLRRILDQVARETYSDYSRRAHPLAYELPIRDFFKRSDSFAQHELPQTIERLAYSICAWIPKIKLMYPRFGNFLEETIFPLTCGKLIVWVCPPGYDESDVLDIDKPPMTVSDNYIQTLVLHGCEALLPEIVEREFTVLDLADEMIAYDHNLESQKKELIAISKAWRGENTLKFYLAVGNLQSSLPWLREVLKNSIKPAVFRMLRKHNVKTSRGWQYQEKEFHNTTANWRDRIYLEPHSKNEVSVSFEIKSYGLGLDNLRGLLLLGRLEWSSSENEAAQAALDRLIFNVEKITYSWLMRNKNAIDLQPIHILGFAFIDIRKVATPVQLASAIEMILPQIAKFDLDAATLIGQAYLPLLGIPYTEAITAPLVPDEDKPKPPSIKKKIPTGTKTRELRINIPSTEVPLTGESIEETAPSLTVLRRSEPSKEVISLKDEIRWVHQRIYGSNQLLIRNHIESLSDAEAFLFARALDSRIEQAITARDSTTGWLGVLVALTLITGQSIGTWTCVALNLGKATKISEDKPQLLLNEGIFRLPIIRPEGAFEPDDSMRSLLEETSQTVDLHLPPSLRYRIEGLLKLGKASWSNKEKDLKRSLDELVSELEPSVGTGISLARVRLVARARIREATNDQAMTTILCGDTFGRPTASLYYTNVNKEKLEQEFRISAWPLFGDKPKLTVVANQHIRVGSELLVTTDTARALAMSKSVVQNAVDAINKENKQLIIRHNGLVDHILRMLMAAAGHRPTSALLELTRFDFDTVKHAAIFKDKQCDPAHLFRFVPTADLVSFQLEKYLDHLRALAESADINQEMAKQARSALLGNEPLFFHLNPDATPLLLKLNSWGKYLPSNWQVLPHNWGRTWLASRGREAGIDADHLSIVLGHLDVTGYPFSKESPLEPAQLSRTLSGPLGQLVRSAGWTAHNGLKSNLKEQTKLLELGPLKDWTFERNQLASLSKNYEIEQRQVLRSKLRAKCTEGEKIALSSLELIIQRPIAGYECFINWGNKQSANNVAETALNTQQPVTLTDEDLEAIQNTIDEATAQNKVLEIAAHNALHRYLKNANKKLGWDCSIPSPWLAPATMEPTPFFPGLFKATNQLHVLRQHYGRIPVKVPAGTSFTPFEWSCGQAIIALCVFGFTDDMEQILEILNGRLSVDRTSTIKDLVLVESDEDRRVVGVRGLAAISLVRLADEFPNNVLPHINRLNLVVAAQLPAVLSGNASDVLTRLCATISVTNIVELSGLARRFIQRNKGCIAMSTARQRQMLEEGYGLTEINTNDDADSADVAVQLSSGKCVASDVKKHYGQLREILHIGDGPKKFKITGEKLTQANIGAFRNPLCREITAFLNKKNLSPLVACIGAFALHMTVNGTLNKKNPAWSTVYSYITSFGLDLVELTSDIDFLNLDAEEYIDLFQDIIDRKDFTASRTIAARELVNFYVYLQKHHDFEAIDFSDLEGVGANTDIQVDAEVIQPQEYALGLAQLSSQAMATELDESEAPKNLRANRQAEVFALLLRYSGARHNELSALRFIDLLATIDSTILLIRPSRYRRLKTSSARRMVGMTNWMTRQEREIVSNWINAEKARLGASWKPTLPIFGMLGEPKDRVSSRDLRDITLLAMEGAVGYRTKIHRARHLVIGEAMLAVWLSDSDWQELINARKYTRESNCDFRCDTVVLPRHICELSLYFGHRKISTTIANYFHMPWAMLSRPHQALAEYIDSHAAAVALGSGISNTYKINYRTNKKVHTPIIPQLEPLDAWLTHIAGAATVTPGSSVDHSPLPLNAKHDKLLSARNVERLLRDIQCGLSPHEACLVHGLTAGHFDQLQKVTAEIQQKTGFKIWPDNNIKRRSAREFQEASILLGILDIMDRSHSDVDRQHVLSVSHAYLRWVNKSARDKITLPNREIQFLVQLLAKLGLSQTQMSVTDSTEFNGFSRINVMRTQDSNKLMNHTLAWLLVVAYIVATVSNS